jgi:hypothetical protein
MVELVFFRYNNIINEGYTLPFDKHTTFSNFSSMYKAQTLRLCFYTPIANRSVLPQERSFFCQEDNRMNNKSRTAVYQLLYSKQFGSFALFFVFLFLCILTLLMFFSAFHCGTTIIAN